jgi:phospholipase C
MRFSLPISLVAVLFGGVAVFGCSTSNATSHPDGGATGGADGGGTEAGPEDAGAADGFGFSPPPAWDQPVARPSDDAGAAGRSSCAFARGDMPAKTLGPGTPIDTQIPLETIVVLMMENRSFDSLLGHMNEYAGRTDVEEPPANASNPAQAAGWGSNGPTDGGAAATDAGADGGADAGGTFPWMHAQSFCFFDADHSWKGQHWAWDNGLNDGFYAENNGNPAGDTPPSNLALLDGERAMWFYDQTDLPFEYQLANTFAFADHYFCSTLGPTYPNRDYFMAATSFGIVANGFPTVSQNVTDNVVVSDELEQRNVTWATYGDGSPGLGTVLGLDTLARYPQHTRFSIADFLTQAAAGTLPQVVWVDPNLSNEVTTGDDDHPPGDPQIGSNFLSQIYGALSAGPQWPHAALFITWDENGGIYDHVPPPPACAPDTTAPALTGTDVGTPGGFNQYGFRVPLIVASPYAKKGHVSHNVYDHTSITRFIEAKFKIPALSARDANADPLMDLFDFTDPPALLAPPQIPATIVDDAGVATCIQQLGQ